jgi:hypothetical protein
MDGQTSVCSAISRASSTSVQPGRKQKVLAAEAGLVHPSLQNHSGLLSDFKLHWMLGFLQHHYGP